VISLFLAFWLFRSFKGCLKWGILIGLIVYECNRNPQLAKDARDLLQYVERNLTEWIDSHPR
jgi:hypothetical protein